MFPMYILGREKYSISPHSRLNFREKRKKEKVRKGENKGIREGKEKRKEQKERGRRKCKENMKKKEKSLTRASASGGGGLSLLVQQVHVCLWLPNLIETPVQGISKCWSQ